MKLRMDEADEAELPINLTPMIDMILTLIVFFVLATNFSKNEQQIDVDLPPAETGEVAEEVPDEIVVTVMKDGRLVLAGREVDEDALSAALAAAAQREPKPPVKIRGDKEVDHGRIVSVMSACGMVGLTDFNIGTLDDGG